MSGEGGSEAMLDKLLQGLRGPCREGLLKIAEECQEIEVARERYRSLDEGGRQ